MFPYVEPGATSHVSLGRGPRRHFHPCRFVSSDARGETITVEACSTVHAATCPACRCRSNRIHGRYVRKLEDHPMLEQRVVLAIEVRRFKCMNANCPRRTFAENIHALAGRYQRRTRSQARALHALGHALGGEAAARLADLLGWRTSADAVLRELRRVPERKRKPRPRVVGIDDWAIACGHQYGTIIVDLERREPIEVFAGREAIAVAAWMRVHQSIEIVARDRAGAYSDAVDIALPARGVPAPAAVLLAVDMKGLAWKRSHAKRAARNTCRVWPEGTAQGRQARCGG